MWLRFTDFIGIIRRRKNQRNRTVHRDQFRVRTLLSERYNIRKKEQFKFLPGHLTLLLGLKIYANKFIDSGLRKSKIKSKELSRDLNTIAEEVEVLSDQELNRLKSILVKKIVDFCRKINDDTEKLSDESVGQDIDIIIKTKGESVDKTTFACPICEVRIPCIHNQHWQVSNLEKHIKTHQTRKLLPQVAGKLDQILNGGAPKDT